MCKTPGKMHMHDIVNIDTIIFEMLGDRGLLYGFRGPKYS